METNTELESLAETVEPFQDSTAEKFQELRVRPTITTFHGIPTEPPTEISTNGQGKSYLEFGKTRGGDKFKFPAHTKDIIFESEAQQKLKEKRKIVFAERNRQFQDSPAPAPWKLRRDKKTNKLVNELFWNALKSDSKLEEQFGENDLLDWRPGIPDFPMKKKKPPTPTCMHPAQVPNGRLRCEGRAEADGKYRYGSMCYLSCHPGYATVGHDRATCDKNGAWYGFMSQVYVI